MNSNYDIPSFLKHQIELEDLLTTLAKGSIISVWGMKELLRMNYHNTWALLDYMVKKNKLKHGIKERTYIVL